MSKKQSSSSSAILKIESGAEQPASRLSDRAVTAALVPGERGLDLTLDGQTHRVLDGRSLDSVLYWSGWEIAPGQSPQELFPDGGRLEVVRSERGVLEDQAAEVWRHAAHPRSADPYAQAVVAAVESCGATIADWDVHVDEDLRIYITLGEDVDLLDDADRRHVIGWTDTRGWFTFLEAEPGEALGSCVRDLPVPLMALPEQVAAEAASLWGGSSVGEASSGQAPAERWSPPSDYVADPPVTGDPTDVVLDLERALAAYLGHPAAAACHAAPAH
ncbi:hypothetical protein SMD44_p10154 (plasmid) [Streptomyces alboflavus]|uniref:DUF6292 domain-containing protein n=1 Tax=Streptomyces alboflavus TaxID=67267 RepID=A0A291W424_9ACTN|nr:DUF6292 family protein [Streptomyces alboflavus]ATM24653.1 hypothetical protein SMD44_p10154 [Streptomyces alboflavus]